MMRNIVTRARQSGFWLILALPGLTPMAWVVGQHYSIGLWAALIPLLLLFGVLPLADKLTGRYTGPHDQAATDITMTLLPIAAALLHIVGSLWVIAQIVALAPNPLLAALIWAVPIGDISGILTINISHELVHRRRKWQRIIGGGLLATVCYGTFKIEHVRWHHIWVATPEDPSTARKGESFYRFLPRAILGNTRHAWRIQQQRNRGRGPVAAVLHHEVLWLSLLSLVFAASLFAVWGLPGLLVFLLQSVFAVTLLEMINYIEHYGLVRRRMANGRWAPVAADHSWNSDYWLSNMLLLNLQRHSDHHIHAGKDFTALDSLSDAPQLPAGYAALVYVVLLPPLWRRIIHPRLPVQPGRQTGQ